MPLSAELVNQVKTAAINTFNQYFPGAQDVRDRAISREGVFRQRVRSPFGDRALSPEFDEQILLVNKGPLTVTVTKFPADRTANWRLSCLDSQSSDFVSFDITFVKPEHYDPRYIKPGGVTISRMPGFDHWSESDDVEEARVRSALEVLNQLIP